MAATVIPNRQLPQVQQEILIKEIAAPTTPASGFVAIYPKADGKLYIKDDTGLETDLTAAGGGGGSGISLSTSISMVQGINTF